MSNASDFVIENGVLKKYVGPGGDVVVPERVKSIGTHAFENQVDITSVVLPATVRTIGMYAFAGCGGMTSIVLPDSIQKIGGNVFYGCKKLTDVTLPKGLEKLDIHAFRECCNLRTVTLPDGLKRIERYAFSGCSSLTDIRIPESVTEIGYTAFTGCSSLTSIRIPNGVTTIWNNTFTNCSSLKSVYIPEGVTGIDRGAFSGCSSLSQITLPKSLTMICDNVFMNCESLEEITIPGSVTGIGNYAFMNCAGLKTVILPDSLIQIETMAFYGCKCLEEVSIPDSVTGIGMDAFKNCNSLKQLRLPVHLRDKISWFYDGKSISEDPSGFQIVAGVLQGYSGPGGNVVVPEDVTHIGDEAFLGCSSLTGITLPEGLTGIGNRAFSGCSGLTCITLPEGVTGIGNGAFSGCTGLTVINLPESLDEIGRYAFSGCGSLKTIQIPERVNSIGDWAFSDCKGLADQNGMVIVHGVLYGFYGGGGSVQIPEGVTEISERVFAHRDALTDISIPGSVKVIKPAAFEYCSQLKSVVMSEGVAELQWEFKSKFAGNGVFSYCDNLETVTIPNSLTKIGEYAFYGCKKLKSIEVSNPDCTIGDLAFAESGVSEARIPIKGRPVDEFWVKAYETMKSGNSVTIPAGHFADDPLISRSSMVFRNCRSLRRVSFTTGDGPAGIQITTQTFENAPLEVIEAPLCGIELMGPYKPQAAVGFAELYLQGFAFDTTIRESYETYIKKRKKALYPNAVRNIQLLHYMLDKKLVPNDQLDECVALAEQYNSIEAKAALIEYRNREFGGAIPLEKEMKLATPRKPREVKPVDKTSPEYLRKIWPRRNRLESSSGMIYRIDCYISRYNGDDTDVVFPIELDGVKIRGISFRAGQTPANYKAIKSVGIPDGYREFGHSAFEGCSELKEAFLPLTTERVCDQLFMNCSSLETAVIPGSWLGAKWLFRDCISLKDVYILSSRFSIQGYAVFRGCREYTVHAPSGSQIEKELKGKHFAPLTESDIEMLAKRYFAEPMIRHACFNRSNMGTRKTIHPGETVMVINDPEHLGSMAILRENGVHYQVDELAMFGRYLDARIVSEVYKDESGANCFDVELMLKNGI